MDAVPALGQYVHFVVLGQKLDVHAVADLVPWQFEKRLLVTAQPPFGCSHKIGDRAHRISCKTSSVGMPRSITHMRSALPYCSSIFLRNPRRVVLSAVLPAMTS